MRPGAHEARVICIKCEQDKPDSAFSLRCKRTGKRHFTCKECHKSQARRSHLKRTFSLTPAQYEQALKEQNGLCAICGEPEYQNKMLAVDHCHVTGVVRGLLCQPCNTTIGKMREDPELLRTAARYVEEHLGRSILGV